jgi:hypothetical protein
MLAKLVSAPNFASAPNESDAIYNRYIGLLATAYIFPHQ